MKLTPDLCLNLSAYSKEEIILSWALLKWVHGIESPSWVIVPWDIFYSQWHSFLLNSTFVHQFWWIGSWLWFWWIGFIEIELGFRWIGISVMSVWSKWLYFSFVFIFPYLSKLCPFLINLLTSPKSTLK